MTYGIFTRLYEISLISFLKKRSGKISPDRTHGMRAKYQGNHLILMNCLRADSLQVLQSPEWALQEARRSPYTGLHVYTLEEPLTGVSSCGWPPTSSSVPCPFVWPSRARHSQINASPMLPALTLGENQTYQWGSALVM